MMKPSISDFTEREFLDFVVKIYNVDYRTDRDHLNAIFEFKRITEHPKGSDLLYYPEPGKQGPQAIVTEVKAWRAAHNKPGFKPEQP